MVYVKRVLKNLSVTGLICFVLLLISSVSHAQPVRFVVTGDSWGTDNGVNTAILAEIAQATLILIQIVTEQMRQPLKHILEGTCL